ncbi:PepSY-associated TM helix domain-containing protein [Adhaeribacter terreus]|uniref:PepSY-associated TM helix domain-containing protein n=1 Tax=Adhaeribacter terreus TaxID=529703 RepID=A0ABW0EDS9_9BACT
MAISNKTLWKIHSWLGLYTGIFIAFLSITGAAAVFKEEIDTLADRRLLKVEVTGERKPYNELIAILQAEIRKSQPEASISSIELPRTETDAIMAHVFVGSENGANIIDKAFANNARQYFVNPYTGQFLGSRDYYKTVSFFIRNLHVRFYDNYWGRPAAGIFGIAFFIVTVLGFLIYGKFLKQAAFTAIRTKNLRQLFADWHKMIGVLSLFFNLMIAVTGAWIGMQSYYMKWLDIKNPNRYEAKKIITPEADVVQTVDYDAALKRATQVFPEMIPAVLNFSAKGENTISFRGNIPGQVYERNTQVLVLDKTTLETRFQYDIRQQKATDKLFYVQEALHFGDFAGLPMKILYVLLGLTSGFLSITGYYIYLNRQQSKLARPAKYFVVLYTSAIGLVIVLLFISHLLFGSGPTSLVYTGLLYLFLACVGIWFVAEKLKMKKIKSNGRKEKNEKVRA